jgi:hypothetical protein
VQLNSLVNGFAGRTLRFIGQTNTDTFQVLIILSPNPTSDTLFTEGVLTLGALFRLDDNILADLAHEMGVKGLRSSTDIGVRINISCCIIKLLLLVAVDDKINVCILEFSVIIGFSFHIISLIKFKFNMKS